MIYIIVNGSFPRFYVGGAVFDSFVKRELARCRKRGLSRGSAQAHVPICLACRVINGTLLNRIYPRVSAGPRENVWPPISHSKTVVAN